MAETAEHTTPDELRAEANLPMRPVTKGRMLRDAAAKIERLEAERAEMLEALRAVAPFMVPGMNWTDPTGELIKSMVRAAIVRATADR